MMRLAFVSALLLASSASVQAVPRVSNDDLERLIAHLVKHPPTLTPKRLLPGYKIGRCLLKVDGHTLISGKCAYSIAKGGEFEFHGPHQSYSGIDYPKPEVFSGEISTDYFVQVDHELLDGGKTGSGWGASWNEDKRATHAHSYLGTVTRKGACYFNSKATICLWKK